MSRPSGVFKKDGSARRAWGKAYDAIPKSVFALAAWHLANVASENADSDGAAEKRFVEELTALRDGGHLDKMQATAAIKSVLRFDAALSRARGE
jgi:hypothetical protein